MLYQYTTILPISYHVRDNFDSYKIIRKKQLLNYGNKCTVHLTYRMNMVMLCVFRSTDPTGHHFMTCVGFTQKTT